MTSGDTIFGIAGMGFVILILALAVMFIVPIARAAIKSKNEEVFRKQAADAIEAQKVSAQLNEKLVTEMVEVKERLSSIERILKEVE
ncbi:hypothetical protein [Bacillus infantis]|uniref:hypothetical protein n=1 Tax=Bacillus infantis TaxID=324767 RepID=UPI00209CA106|nr:hypothetical protein [Bacillus infantis]MCP1156582.1 hypothetical protein [Bacillus infantis]